MELDGAELALYFYVFMRMSGVILFNPIFARNNIPMMVRTGMVILLTLAACYGYDGTVPEPATLLELTCRLFLEIGIGLVLGLFMRFVFLIPEQAGEVVDTQMGMSMARAYDPSSQSNMTMTANLLNILMLIMFFQLNGHATLLQIMLTSGKIIPFGVLAPLRPFDTVEGYGQIVLLQGLALRCLELFAEYFLLAVKMAFPILGAELLGQVGMGVVMKTIPQINVFAINIELKVIIGLSLLLLLMSAFGGYMQEAEKLMLVHIEGLLRMAAA